MSLHYWVYHARDKSGKDAGKISLLSLCNRCGWHSTKVVRDTLSYHPLSHQLHTQWKSCSIASNTWTWASQADFQFLWFDVFRQKTPVHHLVRRLNKMSLSILLQMNKNYHPILNLQRPWMKQSDGWSSPPPDSGSCCQLIYHFLESCPREGGSRIYGLNQDFPIHFQAKPF